MRRTATILLVLALGAAACGEPAESGDASSPATQSTSAAGDDSSDTPTIPPGVPETTMGNEPEPPEETTGTEPATTIDREDQEPNVEPVPPPPTTEPVTGEVPPARLAPVIADAAERTGVPEAEVVVVEDRYVVWNDGSLGCPEPGMTYTQATVPGYRVLLEAGGVTLDYRLAEQGFFALCDRPMPGPLPTIPPTTAPSS